MNKKLNIQLVLKHNIGIEKVLRPLLRSKVKPKSYCIENCSTDMPCILSKASDLNFQTTNEYSYSIYLNSQINNLPFSTICYGPTIQDVGVQNQEPAVWVCTKWYFHFIL